MSSQNEVWIDTAELREKKRKRHVRSISKVLNPLAHWGGYSTAVALNFTQTKLTMPATKQSTISSFFTPRRKGSEKKPALSPELAVRAPIKSEETKPVKDFGCQTSMMHTDTLHHSDIFDMADGNVFGEELVPEREKNDSSYTFKNSKEQTFLHLIRGYESEEDVEQPDEKRRFYEPSFIPGAADIQSPGHQQSSQLRSCLPVHDTLPMSSLENTTQDSQNLRASHHRNVPSEGQDTVFGSSELSEGEFRAQVQLTGRTSTQRKASPLRSPAKHAGKENFPSNAARWRDSGCIESPLKKTRCPTPISPAAKPRPWETKCLSPRRPVLEAAPRRALEMDSMAALFTQDSQGFRVIAHRHQQSLSPLKDRTNTNTGGEGGWRVPSVSALDGAESELEAEMLFTQDSQGNLVIKH